jgi:hypothetical protein
LDKITSEADPQLLSEYRKLFKGIPFFRRSWAAAYLLMLYDEGGAQKSRGGRGAGGSSRSRNQNPAPSDNQTALDNRPDSGRPPLNALPEEESRRLFISIGRNRHLFPREILGLIISKAEVSREDIGTIRILDSYSFVQVRDTVADRIIEALNGTMFRSRTLAVNYARSRREEGSAADEGVDDNSDDYSGEISEQGDDHPDEEGV